MVFTGILTENSPQEPLFRDKEGKPYYEIGNLDDLTYQSQELVKDWGEWINKNQSGPPPKDFIMRAMKIHDAYEEFKSAEPSGHPQADAVRIERLSLVLATLERITQENA